MYRGHTVKVIIPALDEAEAIGAVLAEVPGWVDEVLVADNGSSDRTADVARAAGATVVEEPRRGYGWACLAAMARLGECDLVVFLDGDHSDHPEEMEALVAPLAAGEADLVIGSRSLGRCERGALTPQQRFGNLLACRLILLIWGQRFTDLGPFRAIRNDALRALRMTDKTYGWTVEMQLEAVLSGLRCVEVPVSYRRRIGRSKVSGTVRGVVGAGWKILGTIARYALVAPRRDSR